jgi:hypothetical protein
VENAYDPDRLRALGQRTLDAIAALDSIRSSDPAAAGAMRAARLARRNLEELWMPAIRRIERSDAMVSRIGVDLGEQWRRTPRRPSPADTRSRPTPGPLRSLSDDELLDLVDAIDRLLTDAPLDGERTDTYGADTLPAKYDLDVLAEELARRVRDDRSFRRRLLAHAPQTVVVGQLVGRAPFPTGFVADLVVSLAGPVGARAGRDPAEFGRAISTALDVLADQPAAALRVLLDDAVLHRVATSRHLDTEAVATFVTSALTMASTHRLADGYRVIERLHADRLTAGFSLGLATSLDGFFDTLAPAIAQRDENVVIAAVAGTPDVGSYGDLRALVGEILRHADAAAAIGASIGNYTDRYLDRLGDDLGADGTLTTLAHLVTLLDEASTSEQAQLIMEAGALESSRRAVGDVVGVGVTTLLTASGVGTAARGLVAGFIGFGTDVLASVEPEQLAGASISGHVYHRVSVSALRTAISRPAVLAPFTGREHTDDELEEYDRRLDEIADCGWSEPCGPGGAASDPLTNRADALSVLEQDMGDDSRAVRFLDHVRLTSGLEPLR